MAEIWFDDEANPRLVDDFLIPRQDFNAKRKSSEVGWKVAKVGWKVAKQFTISKHENYIKLLYQF